MDERLWYKRQEKNHFPFLQWLIWNFNIKRNLSDSIDSKFDIFSKLQVTDHILASKPVKNGVNSFLNDHSYFNFISFSRGLSFTFHISLLHMWTLKSRMLFQKSFHICNWPLLYFCCTWYKFLKIDGSYCLIINLNSNSILIMKQQG